jgi:hypothetical protein
LGLFLRHLHARHLIRLVLLRRRSRRRLLLGHLHAGHILHLLALLIAGNRTALVPLLLLFGGLCEDLATFLCKIVDSKGVTTGSYSGFRR